VRRACAVRRPDAKSCPRTNASTTPGLSSQLVARVASVRK
jgi:hypothetical protein